MKKFLNSFKTRSFRVGGYSVIATVAVVLILILVNVGVAVLPDTWTKFDLTQSGIYDISDQTKSIAKKLDMDVNIYWLVPEGSEDVTLENLLKRYVSLSSKLHLTKIDPNENPSFASDYELTNVSNNSLVVESEKRFRYIPFSEVYRTSYVADDTSESGVKQVRTFEGEAVTTSAVSYVVNDVLPKVYQLSGHGETVLDANYKSKVELDNIQVESLNLTSVTAVPEDCDMLMILVPQSDLSEEEVRLVSDYVDRGGNLLLITSPLSGANERDNIRKLMETYGVSEIKGFVIEGSTDNYMASANQLYLLPTIKLSDITSPLRTAGYRVLFAPASGLKIAETKPEGISEMKELLVTSDQAYLRPGKVSTSELTKKEDDIDGPFSLGVLVTKKNADDTQSSIVWYSSDSVLSYQASAIVSGANENLFLNTAEYMTDLEDNIGIHGKTVTSDYLTVPAGSIILWMIILIGVIPLLVIAAGIIVTLRRRVR